MTGETEQVEADGRPLGRTVSIAVAAAAVLVAVLHAVWPELKIDAVTVVLLVVATLPWLSPMLRSIKLGGVELEFREFRQQVKQELEKRDQHVEEISKRVKDVEKAVFSGNISKDVEAMLQAELSDFVEYLAAVGFSPPTKPPRVHVGKPEGQNLSYSSRNAYYDGEMIVIGEELAGDTDVMFREYMHLILGGAVPRFVKLYHEAASAEPRVHNMVYGLWSGLADYFPCSYRGTPIFGGKVGFIAGRAYIRNLNNTRLFPSDLGDCWPSPTAAIPQDVGEIWGGCFWHLRERSPERAVDCCLASAWISLDDSEAASALGDFVTALAELLATVSPMSTPTVRQVFLDRRCTLD